MLTPSEQRLAQESGVSADVCLAMKQIVPAAPLRRAHALDEMMNSRAADNAVAVDVADGNDAERAIIALEPIVRANGCRAFWSTRGEPGGLEISDEVIVMKTSDPYAIVRLRQSNGSNHNVSTADILDRLGAWESICTFDCVGASHDWVALKFKTLPENLCTFAAEVYTFCPDSVDQGVGLMRESQAPELFAAARALCPQVPPVARDKMDAQVGRLAAMGDTVPAWLLDAAKRAAGSSSPDDGIRLLAEDIRRKRYLFLWWD
jgi:Domain of unknown function (DUF4253)